MLNEIIVKSLTPAELLSYADQVPPNLLTDLLEDSLTEQTSLDHTVDNLLKENEELEDRLNDIDLDHLYEQVDYLIEDIHEELDDSDTPSATGDFIKAKLAVIQALINELDK